MYICDHFRWYCVVDPERLNVRPEHPPTEVIGDAHAWTTVAAKMGATASKATPMQESNYG